MLLSGIPCFGVDGARALNRDVKRKRKYNHPHESRCLLENQQTAGLFNIKGRTIVQL